MKIAFQLKFHSGAKPERVFILNQNFGEISASNLSTVESLSRRVFAIFAAKNFSFHFPSDCHCSCQSHLEHPRPGFLALDQFLQWAQYHLAPKKHCTSGVLFRLASSSRLYTIRFSKLQTHKSFPIDQWVLVIGGIRCLERNHPMINVTVPTGITEETSQTNFIPVPGNVLATARRKRNRECGIQNR